MTDRASFAPEPARLLRNIPVRGHAGRLHHGQLIRRPNGQPRFPDDGDKFATARGDKKAR